MKNAGTKYLYDWITPLALTVLSLLLIGYGNGWNIEYVIDRSGLVTSIFDVIKNLPGFFIAALAAISTFNREGMDEIITDQNGNSPTINLKHVNSSGIEKSFDCKLSRRVFLCMLFSYLTAASFAIIIIYIITNSADLLNYSTPIASISAVIIFTFLFWQVITCTFFGLYYLGEKIHH